MQEAYLEESLKIREILKQYRETKLEHLFEILYRHIKPLIQKSADFHYDIHKGYIPREEYVSLFNDLLYTYAVDHYSFDKNCSFYSYCLLLFKTRAMNLRNFYLYRDGRISPKKQVDISISIKAFEIPYINNVEREMKKCELIDELNNILNDKEKKVLNLYLQEGKWASVARKMKKPYPEIFRIGNHIKQKAIKYKKSNLEGFGLIMVE